MSDFWIGFCSGVVSSSLVAVLGEFTVRVCARRRNRNQWQKICECLGRPSLLRAVGGSGSLVIGINTTPWTVMIALIIEIPIDEQSSRGYQLKELSWKPDAGLSWSISPELRRILDDKNARVYANISYEPVHKNVGSVNGVAVGERVILNNLDFTPERGDADDAQP